MPALLLALPAAAGGVELDAALDSADVVVRGRIVFSGEVGGTPVATVVIDRVLRGSPSAGALTFLCGEGRLGVGDTVLLPLSRRPGLPGWSALLPSADTVAVGAPWAADAVDAYVLATGGGDWARALVAPEPVSRRAAAKLEVAAASGELPLAVRDRAREALALMVDGEARARIAAALARSGDPSDVDRLASEARIEPVALAALGAQACSSGAARRALETLVRDGVRGARTPRCGPPARVLAVAFGLCAGAGILALARLGRRRAITPG